MSGTSSQGKPPTGVIIKRSGIRSIESGLKLPEDAKIVLSVHSRSLAPTCVCVGWLLRACFDWDSSKATCRSRVDVLRRVKAENIVDRALLLIACRLHPPVRPTALVVHCVCLQGDFGIGVGTRLYTGSWAVRPDWGTVMRENPDEEGNVVSYDVLMDADPRESTMSVDNVKMDVEHARKEVKSSAREGRGAGRRDGDNKNETSGSEVGSGSDEGGKGSQSGGRRRSGPEKAEAKGSGLEGARESGDRDSGELSYEGGRDKKVSLACCGHTRCRRHGDYPRSCHTFVIRVLIRRRRGWRLAVTTKWSTFFSLSVFFRASSCPLFVILVSGLPGS